MLQASPNGSTCFILAPHSWGLEVIHNDAPQLVRFPWTRDQLGRGAWSVSVTAQVNTHRPRTGRTPVNEDAIISAVKRQTYRSSRYISNELWVSQPKFLELLRDVNWIHATTRGTHIGCQSIVLFIYVACCRTPMVWSLITCAMVRRCIFREPSVSGHTFYSIFRFIFNTDSQYGKLIREFIFRIFRYRIAIWVCGVRGGPFDWDTALQAGWSRVLFPIGLLNPYNSTLPLESFQPLGDEGGRCVGLKPCHLHVPRVHKFWEPEPSWSPKGPSRPV